MIEERDMRVALWVLAFLVFAVGIVLGMIVMLAIFGVMI